MKKTLLMLTLFLSFLGTTVKAQTFEFRYQGQSLPDGATVTIAAEENAFGELSCETNSSADPLNGLMLQMLTGNTANASATLQITHNTLSPQILQWCMGGVCTPFNNSNMLSKQFEANGAVQVQFDASNIQSKGYLMATLNVSVGFESHQVNIQFTNGESAGIANLTLRHAPSTFNLLGRHTAGRLPAGVYIVRSGGKTKKIIRQNH